MIRSSARSTAVPSEGLTISGRIGKVEDDSDNDVDFFAFEAADGNTLSIEIKDALKPDGAGTCAGFPSNIALYYCRGGGPPLGWRHGGLRRPNRVELQDDGGTDQGRRTYIVGVSAWTTRLCRIGEIAMQRGSHPAEPTSSSSTVSQRQHQNQHQHQNRRPQHQNQHQRRRRRQHQTQRRRLPTPADEQSRRGRTPPPPPPAAIKYVPIVVRHWHQDERDLDRRGGRDPIVVAILSVRGFRATKEVDPNSLTFGRNR